MNRTNARENAFLLLFEKACKGDEVAEEIFNKAVEYREIKCDDYVKQVFFGAVENAKIISEEIDKHLVGRRRARLSKVSEAIITLSVYEMMFLEDVPAFVSINEAVKISKKYDDEKAYAFVNGVLNSIAESLGKK